MDYIDHFLRVLEQFEKEHVEYILIGGFAVVLHGFPRLTQDIDVFIKPTESNVRKLKKALQSVYDDDSINDIHFQDLERYPVIRYGTPDGFSIDFIGSIGEAFRYEDIEYETMKIEDRRINVATAESLLKMKEHTMREIDQLDVQFLREKIRRK